MPLSKTNAIRAARAYCNIYAQGGDYIISGPYKVSQPNGAHTTMQRHSFIAALRARAIWRAEIALHLMGEDSRIGNVDVVAQSLWNCTLPSLINGALAMRPAIEVEFIATEEINYDWFPA